MVTKWQMKVNFSKCCHLKIGAQHREAKYELKDSDGVKQEIMEECVSYLELESF